MGRHLSHKVRCTFVSNLSSSNDAWWRQWRAYWFFYEFTLVQCVKREHIEAIRREDRRGRFLVNWTSAIPRMFTHHRTLQCPNRLILTWQGREIFIYMKDKTTCLCWVVSSFSLASQDRIIIIIIRKKSERERQRSRSTMCLSRSQCLLIYTKWKALLIASMVMMMRWCNLTNSETKQIVFYAWTATGHSLVANSVRFPLFDVSVSLSF